MAVVTFALRAVPFLALRRAADAPLVKHLGETMPGGVMIILVVYSLSGVTFSAYPYGLPALTAVALTAAVHLWRRNALVSIVTGTAAYIAMLHLMA
jgi:branched-subunit amino acid transport protein AzlD